MTNRSLLDARRAGQISCSQCKSSRCSLLLLSWAIVADHLVALGWYGSLALSCGLSLIGRFFASLVDVLHGLVNGTVNSVLLLVADCLPLRLRLVESLK